MKGSSGPFLSIKLIPCNGIFDNMKRFQISPVLLLLIPISYVHHDIFNIGTPGGKWDTGRV